MEDVARRPNGSPLILLLAAEAAADAERNGIARDATSEEYHLYENAYGRAHYVDRTGRPYFLMAILTNAPEEVLDHLREKIRARYLTPTG